ncbi:MAG TPA: CDP-alcohol phosphatidyltransferase family protein [Chthoniobacterales bacterium]|nr:CDP-alcohol phosphatidyltransferase family protein [Chthoniobacterales bacterium]
MELSRPQLVILADSPDALCLLFGISLLERLLRVVQRLGFREAVILSNAPKEIAAHLSKPSWAREGVALSFRSRNAGGVRVSEVAIGTGRILVVSAGFYYDARLLKAMAEQTATTLLVDSAPPPECVALWKDQGGVLRAAALLAGDWLSRQDHSAALMDQLSSDAATSRIEACDAAKQPTYVTALRKQVRPVFFPAPSPDLIALAERFPRDVAQNGVLDFPGFFDSPIEDWIVAHLCHTSITPNQVTFVTMLIGLAVTALFATGHLWWGVALAYTIEVLDGVDGKLARTKVETTAAGEWEHVVDYCIELSWWTALAFHFQAENLRSAYWLLLLLVGSDLVDRLAKRAVKKKVGRNLDDVANFDRFIRCIGGRRNINIWILIAALALGNALDGFVLFCWWGAATAAAHVVRALQMRCSSGPVGRFRV